MGIFLKMILTGQKRRKREMWYVSLAAFMAALFMSSVTLFQNIMDRYLMETNYLNYGDWVISAVEDYEDSAVLFSEMDHPYLKTCGKCVSGPSLADEQQQPAGVCIGTVGEAAKKLGNITLYEGRFPQTETEIAMDLASLSAMGYSYELGQTIRVRILSEGEVLEADYLLSGTVKSFAENWKHKFRYPLPNCIVTEEGFARVAAPRYATYFYQLDRNYENLDMDEFTQAFFIEGHAREYNSYVYENRVWGSKETFDAVRLLLTCIGALAMGYLMLSYVSQRRKWYYRLRSAGADKAQIKAMIFMEAACGALPYAFLGMAVPYAVFAAVCAGVSSGLSIPYFFTFYPEDFFLQMLAAFGMILFSVVCAWASGRDKNLSKNSGGITKRQLRCLRRDTKRERNVGRIFLRRQRKLHPVQQAAFALFSFGVCLFLVLCLNKMYEAYKTYALTAEISHDFSASKTRPFMYYTTFADGSLGGGDMTYNMYFGMDKTTEDEICSLIGIQKLGFQTMDQTHILSWQGKENSPVEQCVKEKYEQNSVKIPSTIFSYYESAGEILKDLKRDFSLQGLNEEAFLNGEEIIVLLGQYEGLGMSGQKEGGIRETTIHPGDMAEIVSAESQQSVPLRFENLDSLPGRTPVKVGAVIQDLPLKWRMRTNFFMYEYGIIASEALAQRVAKADKKQVCHNRLEVDLGRVSSFEATQKRLADIFKEQEMEYGSDAEELAAARNVYIRILCIYGVLHGVVLFLFLLLYIHFHRLQDQFCRQEYGLLKQLGMESGFLNGMAFRESICKTWWMAFSVPCGYAVIAAGNYRGFLKAMRTAGLRQWSDRLQDYVSDPAALTADQMREFTNPAVSFASVVLLIIVLAGIRLLQVRKSVMKASIKCKTQ